jgi:hypothetical protein
MLYRPDVGLPQLAVLFPEMNESFLNNILGRLSVVHEMLCKGG